MIGSKIETPFKNEAQGREKFLQAGYNSGKLYHHWRIEPGLGATDGQPDLGLFLIVDNKIELAFCELKCLSQFKLRPSQLEELPHILATDNLLFAVNFIPGKRELHIAKLDGNMRLSQTLSPAISADAYRFYECFAFDSVWSFIASEVRKRRGTYVDPLGIDGVTVLEHECFPVNPLEGFE